MSTCEPPDLDDLDGIARASEVGMLSDVDKAAALQRLVERADAHLANLKQDASRDPYRPASQRALSLPAAIEQAEILAQVVRTVQDRDA